MCLKLVLDVLKAAGMNPVLEYYASPSASFMVGKRRCPIRDVGWMDGWRSLCSRNWTVFLQVLTGGPPASDSPGEVTKMQIPSSMQTFCIRISTGGAQHNAFLVSSLGGPGASSAETPALGDRS